MKRTAVVHCMPLQVRIWIPNTQVQTEQKFDLSLNEALGGSVYILVLWMNFSRGAVHEWR